MGRSRRPDAAPSPCQRGDAILFHVVSKAWAKRSEVTWEQRFGALIELDGDEWHAVYERLEQEWLAAYTAAFVEIALSRGWRRGDAQMWPVGIGGEAFIEAYRHNWDPWRAAGEDVVACEERP